METPICVVDAQTFIDHIHEIKSWVYNGQLRLIVPSSLPENVEVLSQKSQEPKPTLKEAPRPKTLGKPAKKEQPIFDANPKVAKAFLARLQAGKNYETGAFGRAVYEEEENHIAVHFATASEQYSAWKDVEDFEEKAELPADRAESWADKLRRKQITANGNAENKTKGPLKPKLVARTVADNSPWKVQKNAPTISGIDVPIAQRPMMSASLWRIHESIHRNDENQVFVLTDQPSIKDVAQKLNITLRSTTELASLIKASKPPVDLNTPSALEKELGLGSVRERRPIRCTATVRASFSVSDGALEPMNSPQQADVTVHPKADSMQLNGNVPIAPPTNVENPWPRQQQEIKKSARVIQEPKPPGLATENGDQPTGAAEHKTISRSVQDDKDENADESKIENYIASRISLVKGLSNGSSDSAHHRDDLSGEKSDLAAEAVDRPSESPSPSETRPPASNVWSRSFAEALSGQQVKRAPSKVELKSPVTSDLSQSLVKPLNPKAEPPQQLFSTQNSAQDSPDSDEEVVVFQPKRLSAQRRPVQQSSRPTTPSVQSQAATTSLQVIPQSQLSQHPSAKKQVTQKTTPKQKHHQHKLVNGTGNNQTSPKAVETPVIDPDAFGRGFAVNTNQINKGSIKGARPLHSPQPSLFDAGTSTSRPSSSHRQNRTSPSRPSPRTSPKQAAKTPMQSQRPAVSAPRKQTPPTSFPKAASGFNLKQLPIGTGRPSPVAAVSADPSSQPAPATSPRSTFSTPTAPPTLNANAPVFQPGGMSSPLLQSSLQRELSKPKTSPPIQPPIGSGRPSSKSSQQKPAEPAKPKSPMPSEPSPPVSDSSRDLCIPAPTGPRQREPVFASRPNVPGLRNAAPRAPNQTLTQQEPQAPDVKKTTEAPNHPKGEFQRSRPHGANVWPGRQVKRSLFQPDLDHTRAYQPDTVEPSKASVPEVQYVLKSGSTREEARGKGKLWVG